MKILIVDDDEDVLDSFAMLVRYRRPDSVVLSASSGKLALQLIDDSVQVIVSDIKMPEMDGFEFKKRLNEQGLDIPFIYISAIPTVHYKLIGRQLGAVGFLSKPVTGDALIEAIEKAYSYSLIVNTKPEFLTPVAELVIVQVGYEPVVKPLSQNYSIGRSEHSDIRLISKQASREHACLSRMEESYINDNPECHYRIIDYSRNGFLVNGHRIDGYAVLKHGDNIDFPECIMKYFHLQRDTRLNPQLTL